VQTIKNGAENSIRRFISLNFAYDTSLIPVVLKITARSSANLGVLEQANPAIAGWSLNLKAGTPDAPGRIEARIKITTKVAGENDKRTRYLLIISQPGSISIQLTYLPGYYNSSGSLT
jgi:hypothetical protein